MESANTVKADFMDLRTRAELCELCGDFEAAERLRTLSLQIAREVDLTCYAYQLLWRERLADAIEILERNAASHPDSWNVRHSLGEMYEVLGDYHSAAMNYRMAAALTDEDDNLDLLDQALRRVSRVEAAAS
jgi:tetratricopeptide (TPR) repeat protein